MIVLLGSPVDVETADSFIRTLPAIRIAATRSEVLGLALTGIFAHHLENAQQVKGTVIVTMTVLLGSPVEVETVDSFIRTLPAIRIAATRSEVLGLAMTGIFAHLWK